MNLCVCVMAAVAEQSIERATRVHSLAHSLLSRPPASHPKKKISAQDFARQGRGAPRESRHESAQNANSLNPRKQARQAGKKCTKGKTEGKNFVVVDVDNENTEQA